MWNGEVVPKLTNEESMCLVLEVLSNLEIHKRASEVYKKVGQSVHLYGKEDQSIVREAATFWNEETPDIYLNMASNINAELAEFAEEFIPGGTKWRERRQGLDNTWSLPHSQNS